MLERSLVNYADNKWNNVIHIFRINLTYIKLHKLEINGITYLFFNELEIILKYIESNNIF